MSWANFSPVVEQLDSNMPKQIFLTAKTTLSLAALPLLFFTLAFSVQAKLAQEQVAVAITQQAKANRFPNRLTFVDEKGRSKVGRVRYTFDPKVHEDMAEVYLKYRPDYACFVAIDVETGAILNLSSFIKAEEQWDNLVMRSEYPAASVFKMITAAAGLDTGVVGPKTVIPFNGKSTSLYKNQVLRHKTTKWTRNPTFEESFAKSINSVFGRLGVFDVGGSKLGEYAQRFGFDQTLKSDFNLPPSTISLDLQDQWSVAEAASGYTREVTLSPIHAAQIAATVANNGEEVIPYMVESIHDNKGGLLYQHQEPNSARQVIKPESAQQLKKLMRATTRIGSARKSFSGLNRYKVYRDMEIGGKTGSLTGLSPRGRHDWFVGYAEKDGRTVAYASLIINKEKWYVRSAYVARQFIYNYFTEIDAQKKAAIARSENTIN